VRPGLCVRPVHHPTRDHQRPPELGLQPVRPQQGRLHHQRSKGGTRVVSYVLHVWWVLLEPLTHFLSLSLQEMLDIMKSIYDMMGKYTYPNMQDEAPREHVENFFQVKRFAALQSLSCLPLSADESPEE